MMTDYNRPSPRRGFTQSLSGRATANPVVVGVGHTSLSMLALRRAAEEAARRATHLHVVIGGGSTESLDESTGDDREMHTISSILRNRHVTVSPVDSATPDTLLDYCKEVGASLLVIGFDDRAEGDDLENPSTTHRLVDSAACDVLVIHPDQQHGQR